MRSPSETFLISITVFCLLTNLFLVVFHLTNLESIGVLAPRKGLGDDALSMAGVGGAVGSALRRSVIRLDGESTRRNSGSIANGAEKEQAVGDEVSVRDPPRLWSNLTVRMDPVPGGCRHGFAFQTGKLFFSCGHEIGKILSENMSTIQEAAEAVAKEYPDGCSKCSLKKETTSSFPYFRFDQVGPPVHSAATHFLNTVSDEWRVPESGFENLTDYMRQSAQEEPNRRYLYEFNPSIVALPANHRPHAGSRQDDPPAYLASYRLSSRHTCVSRTLAEFLTHDENNEQDLLGLALLRSDLSIVQDVVVSLDQIECNMEDARLFLLNDTVYVGTKDKLIALHVDFAEAHPTERSFPHKLGNRFDSPLIVTVKEEHSTCALASAHNKNVNYFTDVDGRVLAELWPGNPHAVVPISLDMEPRCRNVGVNTNTDVISDSTDPRPSFATVEELNFPMMQPRFPLLTQRPRGTACCVSLNHNGRRLLVGVSHDKTPFTPRRSQLPDFQPNHFLSQFYAFEPKSPYPIVARSGYFCLGFPSAEDGPDAVDRPGLIRIMWDKLQFNETFTCPKIHFVSGMAETVDDPNLVILGYGVNDCLSRFVKVRKQDIASLLFDRDLSNIRSQGYVTVEEAADNQMES